MPGIVDEPAAPEAPGMLGDALAVLADDDPIGIAEAGDYPDHVRDWVFPSPTSATGHVQDPHHLYGRISETGGTKFWFHGLRNCFITVAERELMLPPLADQAAGQPRPPQ